ncbi:MAG: hypothetical protein AAFU63_00750 [Pseudomonadota bacterium]
MHKTEKMRLACGLVTAAAGLAVAIAMQVAGGNLARFLPEGPWFYVVAILGAAAAGIALADGFGRRGWLGVAVLALAAPTATAIGAALAAAVLTSGHAAKMAILGSDTLTPGTLTGSPVLGLLAVADGISTSFAVAVTWVLSMGAVHLTMRRMR